MPCERRHRRHSRRMSERRSSQRRTGEHEVRAEPLWFKQRAVLNEDPVLLEAGSRFGPAGAMTWVALKGMAKTQERMHHGDVTVAWRGLAGAAFLDGPDTAREIVAFLVEIGGLEIVSDDRLTLRVAVAGWANEQLSADAKRKRNERAKASAPVPPRPGRAVTEPDPIEREREGEGEGEVEEESKLSSVPEWSEDVERLCALLASLATDNGARNVKVTDTWRTECRRLIERDGRNATEVEETIRWAQASDFWRPNVLSLPTLRKQFDRLWLQMHPATPQRAGSAGQGTDNEKWWAGALAAEHAEAQR